MLLVRELRRGGYNPLFARVDTAEDMQAALASKEWDIVLADYVMPRFNVPAALSLIKEAALDVPVIVVSGAIADDLAINAMRYGAQDYLMKGNLKRLVPAIEREVQDAHVRRERKRAQELSARLGRILNRSPNEIYVIDAESLRFIQVNHTACRDLGYTESELLQMTPLDIQPPANVEPFTAHLERLRAATQDQVIFETVLCRKDGSSYPVEVRLNFSPEEMPPVFVAIVLDISHRKQAEEAHQDSESASEPWSARWTIWSLRWIWGSTIPGRSGDGSRRTALIPSHFWARRQNRRWEPKQPESTRRPIAARCMAKRRSTTGRSGSSKESGGEGQGSLFWFTLPM